VSLAFFYMPEFCPPHLGCIGGYRLKTRRVG
jgi:hypothetical protein